MAIAELKHPKTLSRRLDAKQAAKLALEYFNELFPNAVVSNVALKEVEFLEEENCWLITLGFDEPPRSRTASAAQVNKSLENLFGAPSAVRKFKIFKVNAKTGNVISMKIRKLD
jgi:hypothetical protein